MTTTVAPGRDALGILGEVSASAGLDTLGARLFEMKSWLGAEIESVERALSEAIPVEGDLARQSARHLLALTGKRLRPVCVLLAASMFGGTNQHVRSLAVSVELVHAATLLHDDVVDVGDERRGAPTARVLFGNAASIFGGDYLLVEALRRIQHTRLDDVMKGLLDVIGEMVLAEAMQLAYRGRVDVPLREYFEVIDGKTGSLFRWAMFAGARAGGAQAAQALTLEAFGHRLGRAFQLVDDLLDWSGSPAETGKALFADLREGKLTYPLLFARERDESVSGLVAECFRGDPAVGAARIRGALEDAGAFAATAGLARSLCAEAVELLEPLPSSRAKVALAAVAAAAPERRR